MNFDTISRDDVSLIKVLFGITLPGNSHFIVSFRDTSVYLLFMETMSNAS